MSATEDRLREALAALDGVPVADEASAQAAVRTRAARRSRNARRRLAAASASVVALGTAAVVWAVDPGSSTPRGAQIVVAPTAGPAPTAPVTPTTTRATHTTSVPLVPIPSAQPVAPVDLDDEPAGGTSGPTDPITGRRVTLPTTLTAIELQSEPPVVVVDGIGVRIEIPDPHAPTGRTIRVLDQVGGGAFAVVGLPDGPPEFPDVLTDGVPAADLTGDGRPDYLLPFGVAAGGPVAVVLTDHGGTWHLAEFRTLDGGTGVLTGLLPRVGADGRLEILHRSCDPNCAEGTAEWRPWVYEDGVFRPAG